MIQEQLKQFERAVKHHFGNSTEAMNAAYFGLLYQEWISCYDTIPKHNQQIIFRTDHEGVFCGRYLQNPGDTTAIGTFQAMTETGHIIGWNHRAIRAHSEVHEWMPLPE